MGTTDWGSACGPACGYCGACTGLPAGVQRVTCSECHERDAFVEKGELASQALCSQCETRLYLKARRV